MGVRTKPSRKECGFRGLTSAQAAAGLIDRRVWPVAEQPDTRQAEIRTYGGEGFERRLRSRRYVNTRLSGVTVCRVQ
jgi:hypothetical protein